MSNSNHTILVLDDDPDIGMMIRIMLEYRGYRVIVIERAVELQGTLQNNTVSLVIMDMLLSGDNGTDVCSSFKSDPATADIPVIMFSAHPNARDICREAGADQFLAKPFDMQDLYNKVDSLISEKNIQG